jgi:hypothetical protein
MNINHNLLNPVHMWNSSPHQLIRHSLHVTICCTARTVSSRHRTFPREQDSRSLQHLIDFCLFWATDLAVANSFFSFRFNSRRTSYVRPIQRFLVWCSSSHQMQSVFSSLWPRTLCGDWRMYPLYPGVCFGIAGFAACVACVITEGAKLACVMRSTGHNPQFLNPFIAVCMVAALGNTMPTSDTICSVDSHCPGFSLSFVAIAEDKNVFSGLKNVKYRVCILCVLWDGSENITAPCLRAIPIAARLWVWLLCLS